MLERLRNYQKDGADLDQLVELSAFGRQFKTECGELGVPVPDDIETKLTAVRADIDSRVASLKASRINAINAELRGLRTQAERRNDLRAELAKLTGKEVEAEPVEAQTV